MRIRASARKHRIRDADITAAATAVVVCGPLDDDIPQRMFALGWDTHGRILELVILVHDDGTREVIHAMKARRQYLDLLPRDVEP